MDIFTNPWVIGIATAIIAGLILYFGFGIGKSNAPSKQMQLGPDVNTKNRLTPKQIQEYLDGLPPLQREVAAQNYKGISVSWKVNLEDGFSLPSGKLHLMMRNRGKYPWVYADINPDDYPQLRIADKNQVFTIEGEIESLELGGIKLKNCKLSF